MISSTLSKKINLFFLLLAIVTVIILPLKKEIWYDESITILCSKGINNDTPIIYADTTNLKSATIEGFNTASNVYKATVLDNGNAFLFNISLHWFSLLAGNSLAVYMLLAKLCAIAALLAFYVLCNLFFKDNIFTGIAIILLAADVNFMGMSHEIRGYSMGTFFIILAGVYFYKFMYEDEKPLNFFLLGMFSVAAVLCHYFNLYVILVFLGYLVFVKKAKLFSAKNIAAIAIPVLLIATYFYFSFVGFKYMGMQNAVIANKVASAPFSALHVIVHSLAMGAVNFRFVFPGFAEKRMVVLLSCLLIIALYITAVKTTDDAIKKRNLHLLFLLGASGTLFLGMLCFKSHHYTSMNYRYNSFCIPFACLYTTYAMYLIFQNPKINKWIMGGIYFIIVIPSCVLFVMYLRKARPELKYNHMALAKQIEAQKITKMEVPDWEDAFLVQSVLPASYKIDYVLNKSSPYFTLYKADTIEKVSIVRNNL